ncbi:ATP-dependent RNA helicase RhlB [Inmirania thermothiophila]|uniref:ATP-dependent RNA helicase RhlB n=1 Tax=Inmirania thermothiophila TaxID=1750597 RepID=A0A3N1XSG2_9GAMM|nr:ATP-dependent RNA helicase RhlB [Inmirania thermothiophila]ROR29579.1 ATP-dependent RNA helicase RhlB [Inmirania thermothiophila]
MTEQTVLTDKTFSELDIPDPVLAGIREAGFERCTPIQAETLPVALAGQDVAGQAQTGTGKTAAFLIATFAHLLRHDPPPGRRRNDPRAVILAPTRELAIQIHRDAEVLGRHTGLRHVLVYGGTGYESQRQALAEGVDVLIGTPGRVIDYFKQRIFGLKAVQVMVLDEADRMFDLGFIRDIRYLLRRMPPPERRLGLLFSATLSLRVTELAYEHMNNPRWIRIEPDKVTADKVRQVVYFPSNEEKMPLLIGLMRCMAPQRALVFVNTKREADRVRDFLRANDFHAGVLSGDVPQRRRQELLLRFQRGELPVLVATDVAARGLHIPDVTHVFNYDLPQDPEDYVHRIGRTARMGAVGDAVSFACETYAFSLPEIEAYIGHRIPVAAVDKALLAEVRTPERRPRRRPPRGHGGRRRGERAPRRGRRD